MLRQQLQAVLDEAFAKHEYISDQLQYGTVEHWEPGLKGDCEDFALWCRARLLDEDIASSLVYCLTESGVGHLVLSVDGWILDCRSKLVRSSDRLDYTWLKLGDSAGRWWRILPD